MCSTVELMGQWFNNATLSRSTHIQNPGKQVRVCSSAQGLHNMYGVWVEVLRPQSWTATTVKREATKVILQQNCDHHWLGLNTWDYDKTGDCESKGSAIESPQLWQLSCNWLCPKHTGIHTIWLLTILHSCTRLKALCPQPSTDITPLIRYFYQP